MVCVVLVSVVSVCVVSVSKMSVSPDAMLHASVGSGGMGIPSLLTRIPLAKQKRLAKCLSATDPVVRGPGLDPS